MFQLTTCSQVLACVQGQFKASAYYAECVDLIRKLVLSSLVGLLSPGTVIQSFATALFSLIFMLIHALMCKCGTLSLMHCHVLPFRCRCVCYFTPVLSFDMGTCAGPYPFVGANLLKLFADAQVFVVALVGLVLRINSEVLDKEGLYNRDFYGNLLLGLLVGTLVPATGTLLYRSPVERALMRLQEIAKGLPDPLANVPAQPLSTDSDASLSDQDESLSETKPTVASCVATGQNIEGSIDVEAGSTVVEGIPPLPNQKPTCKQQIESDHEVMLDIEAEAESEPEPEPEPQSVSEPRQDPALHLKSDRVPDQCVFNQTGETEVLNSSVVANQVQSVTVYNVSTSSGGPATVEVKVADELNPDVVTITCPEDFGPGRLLYMKTANGDELEIPIPDGLGIDDEFDVDMGNLSDDHIEGDS